MSGKPQLPSSWWGKFKIDREQSRQWHIGPLKLIIRCLTDEWQVAHERLENFDDNNGNWEITDTDELPEILGNKARYIFRQTTGLLTITPLLADRPVISRPNTPFNLTAGEEATLYVSSPLWLELTVGNSRKKLKEIAIQRPSDTWFGPSTREGELCYASTTHCRLHLEELPKRLHRAITPVLIRNEADTTLLVERINLPAPLLPLYASSSQQLWTPQIKLIRKRDGDMAELNIEERAPQEANDVVRLSEPRKTVDSGA